MTDHTDRSAKALFARRTMAERAAVERLEKEIGWLAMVLANACLGMPLSEYIEEDVNGMSPPAPEHWRDAARKACEEQK